MNNRTFKTIQGSSKKPQLRMYVDENGNYSLKEDLANASNRFLCLTGIVMSFEVHDVLERSLNDMKEDFFGSTEVVLHRRELISGSPPFEALKDSGIREQFNARLLEIIRDQEYHVLSIVIDKKALVDKYTKERARDPYALALEFLMQRYQYLMQELSDNGNIVMGDILAESRGGREDITTKNTYSLIYQGQGNPPLHRAAMHYSSREIKLKKKKENIAGLQFADLISHPARRYILSQYGRATDIKKTSFEQDIVDILVRDKFRRRNGVIDGFGAVFYPKKQLA